MKAYKSGSLKYIIAGVTLILVVALCELTFAIMNRFRSSDIGRQAIVTVHPQRSDDQIQQPTDFFDYDPILGHAGIPSVSFKFENSEVRHNRSGFRDRDRSEKKPSHTKRVLVLGDSQVWGWGVAMENTIPVLLESRLRSHFPRMDWEVMNFGVSGYGTDQELLLFLTQGLNYSPDYVVLVVFTDNDLQEIITSSMWGIDKPRFHLMDGELCLFNFPPPRSEKWPFRWPAINTTSSGGLLGFVHAVSKRSEIVRFFERRAPRVDVATLLYSHDQVGLLRQRFAEVRKFIPCIRESGSAAPQPVATGNEVFLALLDRLQYEAKAIGAKLFVAFKPISHVYQEDRHDQIYEELVRESRKLNIPVFDILSVGKANKITFEDLFIAGAHLGALGNQMISDAVVEWIRGETQ